MHITVGRGMRCMVEYTSFQVCITTYTHSSYLVNPSVSCIKKYQALEFGLQGNKAHITLQIATVPSCQKHGTEKLWHHEL